MRRVFGTPLAFWGFGTLTVLAYATGQHTAFMACFLLWGVTWAVSMSGPSRHRKRRRKSNRR